jgi:hypothetical protein
VSSPGGRERRPRAPAAARRGATAATDDGDAADDATADALNDGPDR